MNNLQLIKNPNAITTGNRAKLVLVTEFFKPNQAHIVNRQTLGSLLRIWKCTGVRFVCLNDTRIISIDEALSVFPKLLNASAKYTSKLNNRIEAGIISLDIVTNEQIWETI